MTDEELARIILTELRDTPSPSGVHDMLAIAKTHGSTDHYQAQRVGRRLLKQGYVEDPVAEDESLLGSITERGIAALANGDYSYLSEQGLSDLEAGAVPPRPR